MLNTLPICNKLYVVIHFYSQIKVPDDIRYLCCTSPYIQKYRPAKKVMYHVYMLVQLEEVKLARPQWMQMGKQEAISRPSPQKHSRLANTMTRTNGYQNLCWCQARHKSRGDLLDKCHNEKECLHAGPEKYREHGSAAPRQGSFRQEGRYIFKWK